MKNSPFGAGTLNVALTFSGTFTGSRSVYLYAAGLGGRNSGSALQFGIAIQQCDSA